MKDGNRQRSMGEQGDDAEHHDRPWPQVSNGLITFMIAQSQCKGKLLSSSACLWGCLQRACYQMGGAAWHKMIKHSHWSVAVGDKGWQFWPSSSKHLHSSRIWQEKLHGEHNKNTSCSCLTWQRRENQQRGRKKKDAGHREDHRGNRVIFDQLAHGFGIDLTIVVNSNFREEKGRR